MALRSFHLIGFSFNLSCLQGDDVKSNEIPSEEPESERKTTERPSPTSMEIDSQMVDQLPKLEAISKDIVIS